MASQTCDGHGDSGGHCCWIDGQVCQFLIYVGGLPRCSLYDLWGQLTDLTEWRESPVGQWFTEHHPGYECRDWPQNIPEAMAQGRGLCCWQEN